MTQAKAGRRVSSQPATGARGVIAGWRARAIPGERERCMVRDHAWPFGLLLVRLRLRLEPHVILFAPAPWTMTVFKDSG